MSVLPTRVLTFPGVAYNKPHSGMTVAAAHVVDMNGWLMMVGDPFSLPLLTPFITIDLQ